MGNDTKGTVGVTFDGKRYDLALTFNAVCQLEDLCGMPIAEAMVMVERGDFRTLRAFVWAMFLKSDSDFNLQQAGDFCDTQGQKLKDLVGRVVEKSGFFDKGDDNPGNGE